MTLDPEIFLLFIILLAIFFGTIILSMVVLTAVFGFELTEEQKQDEILTQECIMFNIDTERCFLVYGGTDWEPKK